MVQNLFIQVLLHVQEHLDTALNILKVRYPEYWNSSVHTMNFTETYYKHLLIMKTEDFLPYIKFLRIILDKLDEMYNFTSDKDVLTYFQKINVDKNFNLDVIFHSRCQRFIPERLSANYFTNNFKNPLLVLIAEEGNLKIYLLPSFF